MGVKEIEIERREELWDELDGMEIIDSISRQGDGCDTLSVTLYRANREHEDGRYSRGDVIQVKALDMGYHCRTRFFLVDGEAGRMAAADPEAYLREQIEAHVNWYKLSRRDRTIEKQTIDFLDTIMSSQWWTYGYITSRPCGLMVGDVREIYSDRDGA